MKKAEIEVRARGRSASAGTPETDQGHSTTTHTGNSITDKDMGSASSAPRTP